jgi:hypothetical protein
MFDLGEMPADGPRACLYACENDSERGVSASDELLLPQEALMWSWTYR